MHNTTPLCQKMDHQQVATLRCDFLVAKRLVKHLMELPAKDGSSKQLATLHLSSKGVATKSFN